MFQLPNKCDTYIQDVFLRAKYNITVTRAWDGISDSTLNAWLNNFDNDDPRELFFAHRILDSLIYRSREQFVTLLKTMLSVALPSLLSSQLLLKHDEIQNLYKGGSSKWKLFFVPTTDSKDITSSSPYLARELAIHLNIDETSFVRFDDIADYSNDKKVILVFIDDICSTGTQFSRSVKNSVLGESNKKCKVYYTPLVLHEDGKKKLQADCVNTNIIDGYTSVEELDDSYNCFSKKSRFCLWSNSSHEQELKQFYLKLLEQRLPTMYINNDDKFGFGELSLLYSFYYRCPNNAIPLLWTSDDSWSPLIKR